MDIFDFANSLLDSTPQIANDPNNQALVQAIRNRNEQDGQKIAQDICQKNGMFPSQVMSQVKRFFNIP